MNREFKVYFFVGKGGVGKTTCAAAFAVGLANRGYRTLITSLDPAHNLGDVLDMKVGEEATRVLDNLYAIEVDFDKMIAKHLKELSDKIKDIYGYLRIFNLDRYVDTLRHSPGVEEYATLEKIIEIIKKNMKKKEYDTLVFDTPPTGLTIRIMALPTISLIWIKKLMELRLKILERRKAIERITGEKIKAIISGKELELASIPEEDPIFKELKKMYNEINTINNLLINSKVTSVVMIVNPELLPVLEASRAYEFLKKLGIPVKSVVINKVLEIPSISDELKVKIEMQDQAIRKVNELFKGLTIIRIPFFSSEPRGIEDLRNISRYLEDLYKGL